jgi:hypothetical protein
MNKDLTPAYSEKQKFHCILIIVWIKELPISEAGSINKNALEISVRSSIKKLNTGHCLSQNTK